MKICRALLLVPIVLAAAGCDDPASCEESCQRQYEQCQMGSVGPAGCDVGLDRCLDRCYATADSRDGG